MYWTGEMNAGRWTPTGTQGTDHPERSGGSASAGRTHTLSKGTQPYFEYPRILGHELAGKISLSHRKPAAEAVPGGGRLHLDTLFPLRSLHRLPFGQTELLRQPQEVCGVHIGGGMSGAICLYFFFPGTRRRIGHRRAGLGGAPRDRRPCRRKGWHPGRRVGIGRRRRADRSRYHRLGNDHWRTSDRDGYKHWIARLFCRNSLGAAAIRSMHDPRQRDPSKSD